MRLFYNILAIIVLCACSCLLWLGLAESFAAGKVDKFTGQFREDDAATLTESVAGKMDKPSNPYTGAIMRWSGTAWGMKAESTLAVDIGSIPGLSAALSSIPDTSYLTNRVQVLERNGLYLAIQSAITTNLAWQWGYETFWDQYEDETAVATKTGAYYDAVNDLYSSVTPSTASKFTGGTASGDWSNDYANAFDGNLTTYTTGDNPGYVQYDMGAGNEFVMVGYRIKSATAVQYPLGPLVNWTVQGSNNGSSWTTLDTHTGYDWSAVSGDHTFTIANTTSYRYYRLNSLSPTANQTCYEWEGYEDDAPQNFTLVSTMQELVSVPTGGTIMVIVKQVDADAIDDVQFFLTRDGGTTWCQVTLTKADAITPLAGFETWIGDVLFSGPTGQSGGYKIDSDWVTPLEIEVKATSFQVRP